MEMNQEEEKVKGIVPVLACVLQQLCVANDDLTFDPKKAVSKFHALCIPTLGIKGYLERIAKYSGCSPECFVLCLVYIDRIIQSRGFVVNSYSIHRLLITGTMLAAKFFDDHYYNNAYYAKVGGVNADEMNSLEVEFLFMLNFHLFVSTRTYKLYYQELFAHTNNPKAVCGCTGAKVPPLVFPFPSTPDEKSKFIDEARDSTDGPDLSIDDDDDDGYDEDPENLPSESQDVSSPPIDSKQGPPGSKPTEISDRKQQPLVPSTSSETMMTDVVGPQSSHPKPKPQTHQPPQPMQQSSSHHQLPVKTVPASSSTTQPAGRELLGWQSPLGRRPLPEDSSETGTTSSRSGSAQKNRKLDDDKMTDTSPTHRHRVIDRTRSQSSQALSDDAMSDSPVGKVRTLPQHQNPIQAPTSTSDRPDRIGRKASDYNPGGALTRSVSLKQTQFWRFQQQLQQPQLQQPQQPHLLIPTGGIPLQKSSSATLPQSSSFQAQPAAPQQHRLRRGMSSVQSVTVSVK